MTARSLETLIRLASAHAKARLSHKVEEADAAKAMNLMSFALYHETTASIDEQQDEIKGDGDMLQTNKQLERTAGGNDDDTPRQVRLIAFEGALFSAYFVHMLGPVGTSSFVVPSLLLASAYFSATGCRYLAGLLLSPEEGIHLFPLAPRNATHHTAFYGSISCEKVKKFSIYSRNFCHVRSLWEQQVARKV